MGKLKLTAAFLLMAAPAFGSSITLDPAAGTIFGAPGASVGWGFTVHNDSGEYITVTGVGTTESVLPVGTFGTFTDFLESRSTPFGPGDTTVLYDPTAAQSCLNTFLNCDTAGFGIYTLDPGDFVGASDTGTFQIAYNLCTDATCSSIDSTPRQLENQSAVDPAFTIQAAPEPATTFTMGIAVGALLGLLAWRRKHPVAVVLASHKSDWL